MNEYEDLMVRRELLAEAWRSRVQESQRHHGDTITFWSSGVTLHRDGTLVMVAFAPDSWNAIWDLKIVPGSTEVVFTSYSGKKVTS